MPGDSLRTLSASLGCAIAMMLAGCAKPDAGNAAGVAQPKAKEVAVSSTVADANLPKECFEAEEAQKACTGNQAANMTKYGQAAGAKQLMDALPVEMEKTKARWRANPNKDGLAQSCRMMRDMLRGAPQCKLL